jgi:hypothetical protein
LDLIAITGSLSRLSVEIWRGYRERVLITGLLSSVGQAGEDLKGTVWGILNLEI